jgi:hypothetical protein
VSLLHETNRKRFDVILFYRNEESRNLFSRNNATRKLLAILLHVIIHVTKVHEAGFILNSLYLLSFSRNSPSFMELDGSLLCSQEPATGPYPETVESSTYVDVLYRLCSVVDQNSSNLFLDSFNDGLLTALSYKARYDR